eukprot:g3616.t1
MERLTPKRILFSYLDASVRRAYEEGLDDVKQLPEVEKRRDESSQAYARILSEELEEARKGRSFADALRKAGWRLVRKDMYLAAFLQLIFCSCQIAGPLLLIELIKTLEREESGGWKYGLGMGLAQLVGGVCNQHQLDIAFSCGIRVRAALSVLVYRTSIANRIVDEGGGDTGTVINLVSSDTQKFFELLPLLNLVWSAPLMIVVTLALLCYEIGWAAPIGVLALTCMVPTNLLLAKHLAKLRGKHMGASDERVKICTEAVGGMRVLKFNGWSDRFLDKIRTLRRKEIRYVSKELHTFADFVGFLISFPILSVVVAFGAWVLLHPDESLEASTAFGTLALFTVMRFPLMQVVQAMAALAQAHISLKRIASYLEPAAAAASRETTNDDLKTRDDSNIVVMRDVSVGYDKDTNTSARNVASDDAAAAVVVEMNEMRTTTSTSDDDAERSGHFRLDGLNIEIQAGALTAVVGKVGAGKTTLVRGLLGEVARFAGSMRMTSRSIAYAPQVPWIVNESVKENIVLARRHSVAGTYDVDESAYREVVEACGLLADFDEFDSGDRTIIGERGVTLSGGQKARVSLARAAYFALTEPSTNAVVCVFDDPLSALDAHTSKHVFNRLVSNEGLLRKYARVLVTHATYFVHKCDDIVLVHDATATSLGSFDMLSKWTKKKKEMSEDDDDHSFLAQVRALSKTAQDEGAEESATKMTDDDDENVVSASKARTSSAASAAVKQLMTKEEIAVDRVGADTVKRYFEALGSWGFAFKLLSALIVERAFYLGTDLWLAVWTDAADGPPSLNEDLPQADSRRDTRTYLGVYILLAAFSALMAFARVHVFAYGCCHAAESLFEGLAKSVMSAPMYWFETTPLGRITNRMSFDTEVVDSLMLQRVNGVVASIAWTTGGVVVMIFTIPWMAAVLFPVLGIYLLLYRFYRRCCVDMQLLEATTRSPLQVHLIESQIGGTCIRAYGLADRFNRIFVERCDANN